MTRQHRYRLAPRNMTAAALFFAALPFSTAQAATAVGQAIEATAAEARDYRSPRKGADLRNNSRIMPEEEPIQTNVLRKGDDVSLNPQPLPPSPDNKRPSSDVIQAKGTNSNIIIVSGKETNPLSSKLPAAGRVFSVGVDPALTQRAGQSSRTMEASDVDALEVRGAKLVSEDPTAALLRDEQPTDAARRGFDIGMAAAEGQTLSGPGKDQLGRSLLADQQPGFTAAIDFSLARNRQKLKDLAPRGAEIAGLDPSLTKLRNEQASDSARLGFDIGMAVAEGHTADGPGKQSIRDTLGLSEFGGTAAQGGYDSAVKISIWRNVNADTLKASIALSVLMPPQKRNCNPHCGPDLMPSFSALQERVSPAPARARAQLLAIGAGAVDVCKSALLALERNSPATYGLVMQCGVQARVIGQNDPYMSSMRAYHEAQGALTSFAFEIGLVAAEGQTERGPGKDRLEASILESVQPAFRAAVDITVDRNRNAERVMIGSQIAQADPGLAEARTKNPDPRFWLGFDIATAIFGDPRLGAQGNTALGPGSLGVRAALSELGKQGFDSAIKLHLSRTYAE